jgi:hypothetical protein
MAAMTVVWLDILAVLVQDRGSGAPVVWDNVLPMLCQCSAWATVHQQVVVVVLG